MAQVEFTESAQSDLARLDKPVAQRVLKKLRWLAENLEVVTRKHSQVNGKAYSNCALELIECCTPTSDLEKQKIIVRFVRHRREVYKNVIKN